MSATMPAISGDAMLVPTNAPQPPSTKKTSGVPELAETSGTSRQFVPHGFPGPLHSHSAGCQLGRFDMRDTPPPPEPFPVLAQVEPVCPSQSFHAVCVPLAKSVVPPTAGHIGVRRRVIDLKARVRHPLTGDSSLRIPSPRTPPDCLPLQGRLKEQRAFGGHDLTRIVRLTESEAGRDDTGRILRDDGAPRVIRSHCRVGALIRNDRRTWRLSRHLLDVCIRLRLSTGPGRSSRVDWDGADRVVQAKARLVRTRIRRLVLTELVHGDVLACPGLAGAEKAADAVGGANLIAV